MSDLYRSELPAPNTATLIDYWNSMRCGDDLPKRSEIDPRVIEPLLPFTFLLERIAPAVTRFRVAGTQFSDLMGMDVRGMPFACVFTPDARQKLASPVEALFDRPEQVLASLRSPGGPFRPALTAELAILPLQDDFGQPTRAIGCLIAQGKTGTRPRRLDITRLDARPLEHGLHSEPCNVTPMIKLAPIKPGRPAHLRLVVSD